MFRVCAAQLPVRLVVGGAHVAAEASGPVEASFVRVVASGAVPLRVRSSWEEVGSVARADASGVEVVSPQRTSLEVRSEGDVEVFGKIEGTTVDVDAGGSIAVDTVRGERARLVSRSGDVRSRRLIEGMDVEVDAAGRVALAKLQAPRAAVAAAGRGIRGERGATTTRPSSRSPRPTAATSSST